MALIMNCSSKEHVFSVYGKYFTMKAGQIKDFTDDLAHVIATGKSELGMVALPEALSDIEYRNSPEGVAEIEKYRADGIALRIKKLKEIVYNNQVSLRQDLERSNIKADPSTFASDGEIEAMEELLGYQTKMQDASQLKQKKAQELVDKIKEMEI